MYSKSKLAAACAGIVYFLSYVPYMYVAIREEAAGDKIPAWAKSIAVSTNPPPHTVPIPHTVPTPHTAWAKSIAVSANLYFSFWVHIAWAT